MIDTEAFVDSLQESNIKAQFLSETKFLIGFEKIRIESEKVIYENWEFVCRDISELLNILGYMNIIPKDYKTRKKILDNYNRILNF